MADEKKIEDGAVEWDVTTEIANLTSAYATIVEIDTKLLDRSDEIKVMAMKDKILMGLDYYCSFLPRRKAKKKNDDAVL